MVIFPAALSAALSAAATTSIAHADPTTQSCLGNFDTFLACPTGAARHDTECRAREPQRGQGANEHWSGSKRQGPALFLRSDGKTVTFAASYKDHKKTGRVYRFDDKGQLSGWNDIDGDRWNGLSVSCLPDGRLHYLAYYKHDKVVGISRAWKASDGSFSYAMDHDARGNTKSITVSPDLMKRPDHLCRPKRCDVNAKPDLSGIPK